MRGILLLVPLIYLQGCVSCTGTCAAVQGGAMIADTLISEPEGQNCSEMTGERRAKCIKQVDSIKQSIANAKSN
ncbi:MAG: hypothetical protein P8H39_08115 [Thalassotalea sp.]|nr:hypothetical protein [Thalassotalea sp.]